MTSRRSVAGQPTRKPEEEKSRPWWDSAWVGVVIGALASGLVAFADAQSGEDRTNFVRGQQYAAYSKFKTDDNKIFYLLQDLTNQPAYLRDRAQLISEKQNIFVDVGSLSIIGSTAVVLDCSKAGNDYLIMFNTIDNYYKNNRHIPRKFGKDLQRISKQLDTCSNGMRKDLKH